MATHKFYILGIGEMGYLVVFYEVDTLEQAKAYITEYCSNSTAFITQVVQE